MECIVAIDVGVKNLGICVLRIDTGKVLRSRASSPRSSARHPIYIWPAKVQGACLHARSGEP
eukprot:scaffold10146_cov144-Isochrysis_galbana.AAC.2